MLIRALLVVGSAIVISIAAVHGALAQESKPLRVVTSELGGGNDFAARLIASGLTANSGQVVIVENRGGGGGVIAALAVAKAPPDGRTILLYSSNFWTLPFLRTSVPYDPVKDFMPIILPVSAPNVLVVTPLLPVNSVKELITYAKERPGQLSFGSGATGSTPHLAGELFKAMTGVDMVHIPYKASATVITDLIGGRLQLNFGTAGSVVRYVKAGQLRALAVTSARPSALLPGLPTVASSGLRGYEVETTYGIFAPAGTPVSTLNRLNLEIGQVLNSAEIREKFFVAGVETVGGPPDKLGATVREDMARMGKVIKDAGIRDD